MLVDILEDILQKIVNFPYIWEKIILRSFQGQHGKTWKTPSYILMMYPRMTYFSQ